MSIEQLKRGSGRPSSFTPTKERKIYRSLLAGSTLKAAAFMAKIDLTTVVRWNKEGERHLTSCDEETEVCESEHPLQLGFTIFSLNVKKAIALAEHELVENIRRAGKNANTWQANAFLLERRNKEEYGKELHVSHSGEITDKKQVSLNLSTSQKARMGQALLEAAKLEQSMSGDRPLQKTIEVTAQVISNENEADPSDNFSD
jgi:hypothetical protein